MSHGKLASAMVAVFAALLLLSGAEAQTYFSRRVPSSEIGIHPYNSVGLVETRVLRDSYRGSAAVARDPRLLYSCAHLVYEYGRGWATRFAFKRGHNNFGDAPSESYVAARGYRVLAGYAPTRNFNDFNDDFCVAYGGAARFFGRALSIHADPAGAVSSGSTEKMILGYPSDLDHLPFYDTGRYYMHRTGPFATPFVDDEEGQGGHALADWVTTGSGNSGGPVVVWDSTSSSYQLAGILVSGSEFEYPLWFSGIYVLNSEADLAATDALGRSVDGVNKTRGNWRRGRVDASYARREIRFDNIPPQLTRVSLDLRITTDRRGDIDAFIRSPNGRVRVLASSNPDESTPDLVMENEDITSGFLYSNPRGVWRLFFRDVLPESPSLFEGANLHLRSRWLR